MPMIPMKQTVTIRREVNEDEWGEGVATEFTLKCRITEGAKLVRRTSSAGGPASISSEQVVTAATIAFDKMPDIRLTDEIYYTDELGNQRFYQPINIETIRGPNGKPWLTEVNV